MIQLNVPPKMLLLGLRLDPQLACLCDSDGNYLIHTMLLCRFQFHQEIFDLVSTAERLLACNKQGDTILSLAIKNQMIEYIAPSIRIAPMLLIQQDNETQLYPFQLAAAHDCSLTLIFSLLIQQPESVQY
jgi:ankyrin repeat protein